MNGVGNNILLLFTHSVVSDFLLPHGLQHARLPCPYHLLEFAQTHVHQVSDAIQPFHPLLSPSPPTFSLSQHQSLFQCFSISPSNEYSGLISFRIDWFDLLAVQGTPKSLLWHHSSKASILCLSASFIVHLLHPYMTTGKTVTLTIWTFVGKVMSLLFNMLSRFVIDFLPKSKCPLISWLSPSAVILESKKIVCHCFHCYPIYLL